MEVVTEMIQATCDLLLPPGSVTELAALGCRPGLRVQPRTHIGWFNDHAAIAERAYYAELHLAPEGIYVIPNALHSACLARRPGPNVLHESSSRSSDADCVRRHWLLIDIDPVRPSGISSTQDELDAAMRIAENARKLLESDFGWPGGVLATSGNGAHVLYRIDMANDDGSRDLIRTCLIALHEMFTTPAASVDQSVFNAARLVRLYGTMCRKGASTDDRPHRRSAIIDAPARLFADMGIVAEEQLRELAALAAGSQAPAGPPPARQKRNRPSGSPDFDLEGFIAEHNLPIKTTQPLGAGGIKYILRQCPFDPSHAGTSVALGRTSRGAIYFKCQHASCADRTWKDLRTLLDPDYAARGGRKGRRRAAANHGDGSNPTRGTQTQTDDPYELAGLLLQEQWTDALGVLLLRRHRQEWYLYDQRIRAYRLVGEDAIENNVCSLLYGRVEKVTRTRVRDVMGCLRARATVQGADHLDLPLMTSAALNTGASYAVETRQNLITLANGILDIDGVVAGEPLDRCMRPHTPDWLSTVSLPFALPTSDAECQCPHWLNFLDQTFEGDDDRIDLLQEMMGYSYCLDQRFERFAVLNGAGANGKSTVLRVLTALLAGQTSSLSLPQIMDRMLVYRLYGKLANISGEIPEIDRVEEGLLKTIVSGELIEADRKYLPPLQFRPTAKLWFATNHLPVLRDTSIGIWRRMVVIPFNRVVPESERDERLFEKFAGELPAIFVWVLNGLVRLMRSGQFTRSTACEDAVAGYRRSCFPLVLFVEECCRVSTEAGYQTLAGDLYQAYRNWCRRSGRHLIKPLHSFLTDLRAFWPQIELETAGHGMAQDTRVLNVELAIRVTDPGDDGRLNYWR